MRRTFLASVLILVAALLALYATLPIWSTTEVVRAELQRRLQAAGYLVEAAAIAIDYDLAIDARDVVIRNDRKEVVARAPRLELFSTFRTTSPYVATTARLRKPQLTFGGASDKDKGGNDVLLSIAAFTLPVPLERLEIEDGTARFPDGWSVTGNAILDQASHGLETTLRGAGFSDASEKRAGEKISGTVRTSRRADVAGKGAKAVAVSPRHAVEIEMDEGAVLWDAVLIDFAEHPTRASGDLVFSKTSTSLEKGNLDIDKLLRAQGRMSWDVAGSPTSSIIALQVDNLSRAYGKLVKEPFGEAYPALEDLDFTGSASVEAVLAHGHGRIEQYSGVLVLDSVKASSPIFLLDDVDARFPFFSRGNKETSSAAGALSARAFRLGGIDFGAVDVPLRARAGRVEATREVSLALAKGRLVLENLALVEREDRTVQLRANARAHDVDLATLTGSLAWPVVEGRVDGDLGGIALDHIALSTTGTATASLFGGRIDLRDMSIGTPFGRVSTFRLDAIARDLQLADMTATLPLGQITGVLEGHVNDLEIAAGELQSFDIDLHTVERRGVRQTMSIGALTKLSILGGADASSLRGLMLRFVDEFRYSKMGLRGRLRNDTFELHGIEREGDKEYLVKGSLLPPSVNVISHTQQISFAEMLSRLRSMIEVKEGELPDAKPQPPS